MSLTTPLREWRSTITIFLAALAFSHIVAGGCVIPSESMQPTLDPGDVVAVNRLAYGFTLPVMAKQLARWAEPERGDIIIFNVPKQADANETLYIKRVVAVGGDVVEVRKNRVILNGTPVKLDYTLDGIFEQSGRSHGVKIGKGPLDDLPAYRVPVGHVFVMGDHRNNSADSRAWGPLPIERVRGKAMVVALSFDFNNWKMGQLL